MNEEISESAKAIQEVAKTTRVGLEATQKLGSFVARVTSESIEAVTGILSDRLRFMRWERQIRLRDRCLEIIRDKGLTSSFNIISPKLALPIIENASLEENDELQDLWAYLLASAVDPNFNGTVRASFIDIVKQLEVVDVHILNFIYKAYKDDYPYHTYDPSAVEILIPGKLVMDKMKLERNIFENSIDNLIKLRCVVSWDNKNYHHLAITALGVSLVEACTDQARLDEAAKMKK